MINENFVLVGALFNLTGSSAYAYHTLKGKTKPNRVSWFLWTIIPMIALFAQIGEGVSLYIVLMTFMVGFGPMLVLIASFINEKSYWKISKLDYICGALSVLAVILWLITGKGIVAIAFSILADLIASVPTLIKSYKDPDSEYHGSYRNGAISAVITMLTIKNWTFAAYGFSLYMFLTCGVLYGLIKFRLGLVISKQFVVASK